MSEAQFAAIQQIIDAIRLDEVRPGTRIRTSTTLVTCPADMDQIERNLRAIEGEERRVRADERRKLIEELANEAGSIAARNRIADGLDPSGSIHEGVFIPASGGEAMTWYQIADWLRAQNGVQEGDERKIYIGFRTRNDEGRGNKNPGGKP
jgi:hypothetical protein